LEPIGQQILTMTPAELANFRMPANLGGSSPSIHKRILKKIYGPERGAEVAADLFKDPIAVLPTVLARLKQKDEEWRFTQVNKSKKKKKTSHFVTNGNLARMGQGLACADAGYVLEESRSYGNSCEGVR